MATQKVLRDGRFVHRVDRSPQAVQPGWIRLRVSNTKDSKRYWTTMTIADYTAKLRPAFDARA